MPVAIVALEAMHCTNHVERGPSDAVWGAAVLHFIREDGSELGSQYIAFHGRRGSSIRVSPAQMTTGDRCLASFHAICTMKRAEGYRTIDWREPHYGLVATIESLRHRTPGEGARAPGRPRPSRQRSTVGPVGNTPGPDRWGVVPCTNCGLSGTHTLSCALRRLGPQLPRSSRDRVIPAVQDVPILDETVDPTPAPPLPVRDDDAPVLRRPRRLNF